ncbi:MAG: FAD-binding oxidoreductase [Gammaproteobacteria bacterium]|nr:FAD-binding oxidoreductase [Gammaproteobacteria bacterium]
MNTISMTRNMKWWGWGAEGKEANLSNMPKFLPYVEDLLGCDTTQKQAIIALDDITLPSVIENNDFVQWMQKTFSTDQLQQDKKARLIHSYGKSYRDLARIRQGQFVRIPDLVIFPNNQNEVSLLINAAIAHNVCLIPFGGGTNIVGALESHQHESRMIVSVDMSRMNQVLEIDAISHTALIQAGAFGPEIEAQLNAKGFMLGHFPDSFEFSTLGGWLATRSVGMQSHQYGSISDMALAINCVTPQGLITLNPYPHASMGPDLNQLILGSEGRFGIITQAVMKVHPVPATQAFGAILFPNFSAGIAAIQDCVAHQTLPHMMRLLDVEETQLSFHFKSKKSPFQTIIDKSMKRIIRVVKNIDFSQCCVGVLAFSGTTKQIRLQRKQVLSACRKHGAVYLGAKPGNDWYQRKYEYPYLRDVIMDLGCVVDVAETTVLWKDVATLYSKVKEAGYAAMANYIPEKALVKLKKPGYFGCHLSHHYQSGTCLYYTFAFMPRKGQEQEQYDAVKTAITNAIVAHKGSVSHHHSIGFEHAKWLPDMLSNPGVAWLQNIKAGIDPQYILNPKSSELRLAEDING